jgi:hypothetical protein
MGFLSKLWKGIKKVVGAVAMIAAPFVAAPIAGMIGISGTIGTALTGAAIGGLGAAAAGVNPLVGAALGGLGGFGAARAAAGGGGGGLFGGLFGRAAPAAAAAQAAPSAAAGLGAAAAPAAVAGAAPAAAAAGGGLLSGLNLGNIAPLAMAMFGKSPQNLTPEELAAIERNKETAATERGVFNQRLDAARSLIQQGEANPERAFAEAQMSAQRGLRDTERTAALTGRAGMQDAQRRRAAIEGARIGTAAVTGEQARAAQTTAAGLSALPTNVPTTGEELNMAIYKDLYKRRADFGRDLSGAFGQMYGNLS